MIRLFSRAMQGLALLTAGALTLAIFAMCGGPARAADGERTMRVVASNGGPTVDVFRPDRFDVMFFIEELSAPLDVVVPAEVHLHGAFYRLPGTAEHGSSLFVRADDVVEAGSQPSAAEPIWVKAADAVGVTFRGDDGLPRLDAGPEPFLVLPKPFEIVGGSAWSVATSDEPLYVYVADVVVTTAPAAESTPTPEPAPEPTPEPEQTLPPDASDDEPSHSSSASHESRGIPAPLVWAIGLGAVGVGTVAAHRALTASATRRLSAAFPA
ncbi:hypothetical protein OMK64_01770 [Cellulomonas fimi]|uniref:hypothetical protein n=1 Tax=Cellulomonas fimi TaxID=1708 RepID=UPI00234E1832|nr:hypothetical protein [Cellulomonas fimi]MDC7120260.1 hypothetical protein [Cellulomonas fimi]